jgi:uncharacterized protein (TIGR02145 family)
MAQSILVFDSYNDTYAYVVNDVFGPTSIQISNSTIQEHNTIGQPIGSFTTQPTGHTYAYSLVSGIGDSDNSSFLIDSDTLLANAVFVYDIKSTYSILVRSTNTEGFFFDQQFTITIFEIPVINAYSKIGLGWVNISGTYYPTVLIGGMVWTAKNLDIVTGISYDYDNNPAMRPVYGRLYDLATAISQAPTGWHLAYDNEWHILSQILGGTLVSGGKLKSEDNYWTVPGTDDYGFSAPPGGKYNGTSFTNIGIESVFWTKTINGAQYKVVSMNSSGNQLSQGTSLSTDNCLSVRYVKNFTVDPYRIGVGHPL